jgi:hypothetical protein
VALDLPAIIAKIRPAAQEAIDGLLQGLGKDCQLVFPGKPDFCPNCVWDPTAKRSSGRAKAGAAQPFAWGTPCPVCKGLGRLADTGEILQPVKLLISWDPAKWWVKPPVNIQVPAGMMQTKGFLTDLPRVLQSRILIAELPIEPVRKYRFQLAGEPIDPGNILQARYFVVNWTREGG